VPVYMADRILPGITIEQFAAIQQAAIKMSRHFSAEGKPVRYIRALWVPSEAHVMCLFEAPNAKLVQEVNEAARIPFERVLEAVDLTPTE
jgi:hypothetical protein